MLSRIRSLLAGKKSYLGAIAFGLVGLAWGQGWLTDQQAAMAEVVIASLTGISFRAAIAKGAAGKSSTS